MYDPIMVKPMREEAVSIGFKELLTPEEVKEEIEKEGTAFVFVNSVCGCAAGQARPGLNMAIKWAKENNVMPDRLLTVFAGMEKEAVETARSYFTGYPPSSPQMALLKDGKLVGMIERLQVENNDALAVGNLVAGMLKEHCEKETSS
ncbi:MAG TPA: BrxA/BrxB family bacilliredoxin [Ignavibacteria bacterium]|nr:BrxA/BrxB family bacilliredoxin [Ignavibacteria bacterium]